MIGWVFPGQGSQFIGMGAGLAGRPADDVFAAARAVLGWDVRALCLQGPEELLGETDRTQPAMFTASLAAERTLRALGLAPDVVAGHSVGELSALAAADVLSLEDALRLVAVRADGMASAARSRPGGMLAILGLPLERVEQIVGQSAGVTAIANVNGPGQIVVSGEDPALPDVAALAREAGAKRVVRLAVGAACHSPLMQEARDAVAEAVREVTWRPPRVPVVSGVTGQTHEDPAELARLVVEGVTAPVRWEACVRTLTTRGTATFVEVGPGSVLSSLVKRLDRDATLLPAGTDEEIDALAGREDMQRGVAVGGPAV